MTIIRENIGIAVVALILSLLIKGYVWMIDPPTSVEMVNINVQATNVPVGLSVTRMVPNKIEIELNGAKSKIESFRNSDITAIADLTDVGGEGEYLVKIRLSQSRFHGVKCNISPESVMIHVGQFQKKFFNPNEIITGDFIGNRMISRIEGLPDTIEVSGSVTALQNVQKVNYQIDISKPGDSISQVVKFNAISRDDKIITNLTIDPVSAKITVFLSENTLSQSLPVVLNITGTPATDYSIKSQDITPLFVEVSGAPEILKTLTHVETENISINGRKSDINKEIKLISPSEDIVLNPETVRVKIGIDQVASRREINDIMIEIRRKKTGYKYSLKQSTVNVVIQGPLLKTKNLDLNLIKPSIDVSTFEPGTYSVRLNAGLPSGISLISIVPAEIELIVEKRGKKPAPAPIETPE